MARSGARDGSPQDWLARALSNLTRARQPRPKDVFWEDLCFDAQQAAEKSHKAVLVSRGSTVPRTHSFADLLTLLSKSTPSFPE